MNVPSPAEFSRRIPLGSLSRGERVFKIEADAKERHNLATRLDLVSLDSMKAKIRLVLQKNKGDDIISLFGELEANVVQSCVVSMKPVPLHIEATFKCIFTTAEIETDVEGGGEIKIDANSIDLPDKLIDDAVEIGECTAEQLALELPPFPRLPGISFNGFSSDPNIHNDKHDNGGPFSKLAKIREKLK